MWMKERKRKEIKRRRKGNLVKGVEVVDLGKNQRAKVEARGDEQPGKIKEDKHLESIQADTCVALVLRNMLQGVRWCTKMRQKRDINRVSVSKNKNLRALFSIKKLLHSTCSNLILL